MTLHCSSAPPPSRDPDGSLVSSEGCPLPESQMPGHFLTKNVPGAGDRRVDQADPGEIKSISRHPSPDTGLCSPSFSIKVIPDASVVSTPRLPLDRCSAGITDSVFVPFPDTSPWPGEALLCRGVWARKILFPFWTLCLITVPSKPSSLGARYFS